MSINATTSSVTRGGGERADTVLAIAQAALAGYVAIRSAQAQARAAQAPQQNGYSYPTASYGQQGHQPPPQNNYAPAPGYADSYAQANNGGQQQYQQPQSQYQPPPQAQQTSQLQYQQPQQQQPYQQFPQPQYQSQPQQQGQLPSQGQYQQQGGNYYPPPQPAPYGAPVNYQQPGPTRGEKSHIYPVVYDRSRLGDKSYFANGCGALLTTEDQKLIFTPGCDQAPRIIPARDILEVRLNTTAGKDVGAFHVMTRKGLYLNLAPPTGARDDGRTAVEALRKGLGLDQ